MNIVIINKFWKFPGTKRWDFETICYEKHICHEQHDVTYIVDARGKLAVTAEPGSYDLYEVDNRFGFDDLEGICTKIISDKGPIDRIIAFSENLLVVASQLRQRFDIPGPGIEETQLVKDKVLMKTRLQEKGIRVPQFARLPKALSNEVANKLISKIGFPVIIKPVDGASSIGVSRVDNQQQLQDKIATLAESHYEWEIEEFIEGDIYHVDGLVDKNGKMLFCTACRYINTCIEFDHNSPLGGVMAHYDSDEYKGIEAFTQQSLSALNFKRCPFHLELFVTKDNEIVFLEVAARVSGVDIPDMLVDVLGVNPFEHWINLILTGETSIRPRYDWNKYGSWMIFGLPENLPRKVTQSFDAGTSLDSIYRQFVPDVGDVLVEEGGYCALQSGRFLLSNTNYDQLVKDTEKLLADFGIESAPVKEAV